MGCAHTTIYMLETRELRQKLAQTPSSGRCQSHPMNPNYLIPVMKLLSIFAH